MEISGHQLGVANRQLGMRTCMQETGMDFLMAQSQRGERPSCETRCHLCRDNQDRTTRNSQGEDLGRERGVV